MRMITAEYADSLRVMHDSVIVDVAKLVSNEE